MVNQHQRLNSVPHVRLAQPLPPLPLDDISPRTSIATQISHRDAAAEGEEGLSSARLPSQPRLSIATQIPYRDNPDEDEDEDEDEPLFQRIPSEPPRYEPMHDYLRARGQSLSQVPACTHSNPQNASAEPYQDEPFVVTIVDAGEDASQPPPPSYNELYQQNEMERRTLMRQFDLDETPGERMEMLCKWVVAMLLISLTVACVGTAFNWGRLSCNGGRC